ncbi:MAG: hypothetical protein KME29_04830 [Calothrix sp. FI2-JRJ7]|jgi:hypothetical protein|nr:hypothetical protein [Calothrix sp. FI2-JRJ7]
MKNVKTWNHLIKAYGAANALFIALGGIEAHDKEFYEQSQLKDERAKALVLLERVGALMNEYGAEISGADEDF